MNVVPLTAELIGSITVRTEAFSEKYDSHVSIVDPATKKEFICFIEFYGPGHHRVGSGEPTFIVTDITSKLDEYEATVGFDYSKYIRHLRDNETERAIHSRSELIALLNSNSFRIG